MAYENRKICKLFYKFKKSHLTMKGREVVKLAESGVPPNEEYDNITRTYVVKKDGGKFINLYLQYYMIDRLI